MKSSKQPIYAGRLRSIPAQFSWIDHRLVRDRHLDRLDVVAAALYLFLVTVADRQGLSWYADSTIASRLSIDLFRLQRARADLIQSDLVAYVSPLYQVLAIARPLPPPLCPDAPLFASASALALASASAPVAKTAQTAQTAPAALPSLNAIADRATVEAHLATLRTLLRAAPRRTEAGKQP